MSNTTINLVDDPKTLKEFAELFAPTAIEKGLIRTDNNDVRVDQLLLALFGSRVVSCPGIDPDGSDFNKMLAATVIVWAETFVRNHDYHEELAEFEAFLDMEAPPAIRH